MSIKVMSLVWDRDDLDAYERLLLLSIADHANDLGRCYPSIRRLARRTNMTGRGVQKVIARLVERGILSVQIGSGKGGVNVFFVNSCPEQCSPPNPVHPGTAFITPPNSVPITPEPRSPKPSLTTIEPSIITPLAPQTKKPQAREKARLPDDWVLSNEGWAYARIKHIPEKDIHDEAIGFHAYWTDRQDREAAKSRVGWEQCWAGWCRRIARRYAGGSSMAGKAYPGGYGQGSSIARIVARRRVAGQI